MAKDNNALSGGQVRKVGDEQEKGGDEQEESGGGRHLGVQSLSSLGCCSTIFFLPDLLPSNFVWTQEVGILKSFPFPLCLWFLVNN